MKAILALLDIVPGWLWALICAGLLATTTVQSIHLAAQRVQVAQTQGQIAEIQRQYALAAEQAQAQARQTESDLRAAADKLRSEKDAQIDRLRADVRALRRRLPDLPARPASDPGARDATFGQAPPGSPGPIVYRDTAEALFDEAERADRIRIELKACYAAYDKARELIGKK